MRFILPLTCCLFILTTLLSAQNVPAFPIGEQWQFPDARSLGMAGAGSVSNSGNGALVMNPAALAKNTSGLHITFSPLGRSLEERRAFPIYDRFGSFLTNGIYVVNSNWFGQFQGGAQYNFQNMPFLKSIAIGAFTELDHNYRYEEEVRENDFEREQAPFAYNQIINDGAITRFSFGAAFQLTSKLHAGIQAGLLSGSLDQETSVVFVDPDQEGLLLARNREISNTPIAASLGAVYQVDPYVSVGAHFELPYTLDYDVTNPAPAEGEEQPLAESIDYPMSINFGLEYRGQQALKARLNIDISYEWWSEGDYLIGEEATTTFDDAVQIKAGVEHLFFNQVPFLVGIQYRTTYQNRQNTRLMFSAGSGFRGNGWQVDLAAGLSKVEYTARDLFDDSFFGGDRSGSPIDDVEESYFFGMATLKVDITP